MLQKPTQTKTARPSWRTLLRHAEAKGLTRQERARLRAEAREARKADREHRKPKSAALPFPIVKVSGKDRYETGFQRGLERGRAEAGRWTKSKAEVWSKVDELTAELEKVKIDRFNEGFEGGIRAARRDNEAEQKSTLDIAHRIQGISVVCAFLAEIEDAYSDGKPLPKIMHVAGFTMARLIEALREAGYTTEGKQGSRHNQV